MTIPLPIAVPSPAVIAKVPPVIESEETVPRPPDYAVSRAGSGFGMIVGVTFCERLSFRWVIQECRIPNAFQRFICGSPRPLLGCVDSRR
jgi:hypothetical protein